MNYRQLRQLIDKSSNYLKCKWEIVDNIDNLSNKEKQKIYKYYKKKFGGNELWFLLRSIYNFIKCQDRVG
jgi:hypothetical protein